MANHFEVSLENHVIPMLQFVRKAVELQAALREVDDARKLIPRLDETLKNLGCLTDIGQSIEEEISLVLLSAVDMIECYQLQAKDGLERACTAMNEVAA